MKRILLIALVVFILCPVMSVHGTAQPITAGRFALLETDSGALGSTVNYFSLRPVMQYADTAGVATDVMFNNVVFALKSPPSSAEKAEGFITELFKQGACLNAAEAVAAEMLEGGHIKDKYPVYVGMPYVGGIFATEQERQEFCRYFVDTVLSLYTSKGYNSIYLAGVFFGVDYDAMPDLRTFCINYAAGKELLSVVATAIGGDINADKVFAYNRSINKQPLPTTEKHGYTLTLSGVPQEGDPAPYIELEVEYNTLKSKGAAGVPLLFRFDTFNTVYDCASAMENTVPNAKARAAYDLLKQAVDNTYDKPAAEESTANDETKGRVAKGVEYAVYAVLALIGTAGFVYLAYVLYKKGKNNG